MNGRGKWIWRRLLALAWAFFVLIALLALTGAAHAQSFSRLDAGQQTVTAETGLQSGVVTSVFAAAFVALVVLLCFALGAAGGRELVIAALAACVAFAAFGKVLSPQFLIWLVPLGALAFASRLHALAGALAIAAVLTQIEFPAHYFDVVAREPLAIALVAARNLALLAVIVLSVRALHLRRHEELLDGDRAALAVGVH